VRENYPEDLNPRSGELLVKALEAVAAQDSDVQVERDPEPPPRWVTVTVNGQQCTLNVLRVDAPWSLRSTLQQALRFVQGHLSPAPAPAERLMRIEVAATNGMLSALDRRSRLVDPETWRGMRSRSRDQTGPTAADAGASRAPDSTSASGEIATTLRSAGGPAVAYLRLSAFPAGASDNVQRALATFERDRPKGLVLDLRDNPGGLLEEAVKVADAFVQSGILGSMVSKKQRKDFPASNSGREPSGALVVLVNGRTAAGSELVAAAIKNLGRGIVVGEPTAGAGSIQAFFDIPRTRRHDVTDAESQPFGLLLTIGRLLAAGGAEIDGRGVRPDLQPAWPVNPASRPEKDCLLQLAQASIIRAAAPEPPTLLSTAKTLAGEMACPP
jgi:hypothetical protein